MFNQFRQLLLTTGQDGASATTAAAVNTASECDDSEARQILAAWSNERQGRIEAELSLDLACSILNSILADDGLSVSNRRRARRLLRTIRAAHRGRS